MQPAKVCNSVMIQDIPRKSTMDLNEGGESLDPNFCQISLTSLLFPIISNNRNGNDWETVNK